MTFDLQKPRCLWPGADPLYCAYHDEEWGVPERDGQALWGKLSLDGFQAGLAWITILRKRRAFGSAFAEFNPQIVARFTEADIACLLANPGIIRSRAKVLATVGNARAYLDMQEQGVDFSTFVWSFVGGAPLQTNFARREDVPVATPQSEALSKALKARGFKFVGPVIVYAFMQAVGMTNDHVAVCFRHKECALMM